MFEYRTFDFPLGVQMTEAEFNQKIPELIKKLEEWWQETKEENELKLDDDGVFGGMPVIDSKAVMGASHVFEEIFGKKITAKDVQKGGYSSFDEFKSQMIEKFREKIFKKEEQ